jgi:hypothetical protein
MCRTDFRRIFDPVAFLRCLFGAAWCFRCSRLFNAAGMLPCFPISAVTNPPRAKPRRNTRPQLNLRPVRSVSAGHRPAGHIIAITAPDGGEEIRRGNFRSRSVVSNSAQVVYRHGENARGSFVQHLYGLPVHGMRRCGSALIFVSRVDNNTPHCFRRIPRNLHELLSAMQLFSAKPRLPWRRLNRRRDRHHLRDSCLLTACQMDGRRAGSAFHLRTQDAAGRVGTSVDHRRRRCPDRSRRGGR